MASRAGLSQRMRLMRGVELRDRQIQRPLDNEALALISRAQPLLVLDAVVRVEFSPNR